MTGDIAEIMKKNGSGQGEAPSEELCNQSPKGSLLPRTPLGKAAHPRVALFSWQDLHLPLVLGTHYVVAFIVTCNPS